MKVFARNNQSHQPVRHSISQGRVGWCFLVIIFLASLAEVHAQNLQDLFTNRVTFTSLSGDLTTNNSAATVELNEPKHGGKTGGHSMWISWTASADGVVTFDTSGSTFDTLLSAYYFQNTNDITLDKLKELARNDDAPLNPSPSAVKTSLMSVGAQAGKS